MRFRKGDEFVTVNPLGTVFTSDGKIFMQFDNEYDAMEYLKDSGYEEAGYAGR